MSIDEMIEVLTAAKAGKQIQSRFRNTADKWQDANPCWDFLTIEYRVKPEPREWTVWISPDGNIYNQWSNTNWPQIKVREVLE